MMTFCTLFDSNYLDKGIALYRSLSRVLGAFSLYILPMDDLCSNILKQMKLKNVVLISAEEFEDEELKRIKAERSRAEYCWTCTASLLDFILENYKEEYCTYLDADLYFYQSPLILLEEMCEKGSSVQIVEHRFGTGKKARRRELESGKYCVQFNTFKNNDAGRTILRVWKEQCRNQCSMYSGAMGDQKYLNDWKERYTDVHVLENHGGGMAPWNIGRYRYLDKTNEGIHFLGKDTKQKYTLVFYHFHNLEYVSKRLVKINVFDRAWNMDSALVEKIYTPYLRETETIKEELYTEFGFRPQIKKHLGIPDKQKKNWTKRLKGKSLIQILEKIEAVLLTQWGKKRDIINLDVL